MPKWKRSVDHLQRLEDRRPSQQPTTRTTTNNQNKTGYFLIEQMLRKQIGAAKDDPVLTELLETALEVHHFWRLVGPQLQ
eukprot:265377-Amphidinium_carterae.1